MTVAPAGMLTFAPIAVMTPFAKTIVPFAIGAEVTGTIVALRIANVLLVPGLLMITDWAKSCVVKKRSVAATFILRRADAEGPVGKCDAGPSPRFAGSG